MSKIIRLQSQNVKRLSAVEITPDGNVVIIGGKNGQGKSSVLDSIMYALGGGSTLPQQPVRSGQPNAEIVVDLGELVVKRTFTAAGGTNLVVTNKDGAKYPSPQAILDKLVGTLSFDPLEFARRTEKQAETLRQLVGLNFNNLDAERAKIYDERTVVNREVKSLSAQVAAKTKFDGVPDEEVQTADILKEQQAAAETNATNARLRTRLERSKGDIVNQEKFLKTYDEQIVAAKAQIESLQESIKTAEAQKASALAELQEKKTQFEQKEKEINALQDIDLTPFQSRAQEAEATNQKVRANRERAGLQSQLEGKQKSAAELTAKIEAIDAEKQKLITSAKYPIPGLSFDNDGNVLFNGIPFSQASSADQTKVSIAIGLALNPKLRVLLIRDGSLLDEESLAMVADIAAKNDAQVWMERVSTGGEVSVVIEDGMVAA